MYILSVIGHNWSATCLFRQENPTCPSATHPLLIRYSSATIRYHPLLIRYHPLPIRYYHYRKEILTIPSASHPPVIHHHPPAHPPVICHRPPAHPPVIALIECPVRCGANRMLADSRHYHCRKEILTLPSASIRQSSSTIRQWKMLWCA